MGASNCDIIVIIACSSHWLLGLNKFPSNSLVVRREIKFKGDRLELTSTENLEILGLSKTLFEYVMLGGKIYINLS